MRADAAAGDRHVVEPAGACHPAAGSRAISASARRPTSRCCVRSTATTCSRTWWAQQGRARLCCSRSPSIWPVNRWKSRAGLSRSRSSSAAAVDITTEARGAMSYKAIYTYAWDLMETGVAAAASEFRDLGLDTVTIAGSYHAGKFMRPHGRAGKVYFPDDGTVYFNADPSRYGAIKPVANGLLGERDVLRRTGRAERNGRQRLAGAAAQHAARHGAPGRGGPQRLRRPLLLQPLPIGPGGAGLRHRPRARRHRELRRRRHLARSAGLHALCPRLSPRIRADEIESVAREHARPLLLQALRRRGREGRHRRRPLQGGSRGRHRRLSRQRHRLSRRHGRGFLARRHRWPTATCAAISISATASSPRWSPKSAPPSARTPTSR